MQMPELFHDRMELAGNTDLYVDGCCKLLECSDMLMLMQLGTHRTAVWGKDLTASDYSKNGIHIHGEIAAIEFDGGL